MSQKLTDTIVKNLPCPDSGNKVYYDADVRGFGCRVTAKGARAFILNYRTRTGRERRYTIGKYPAWKTGSAREEAKELKKRVDRGEDPLADVEADRDAKTVGDLCKRFDEEHLSKKRESTARDYRAMIEREIKPALKHRKVSEIAFSDIDGLHRKITKRGAPYHANRVLSVLSKMFNLAIRWGWRADNPCKGVERNQEQKRHRYLTGEELAELTKALSKHEDQQAANIVRLLLLTGARRGEVLSAKWSDIDLEGGVWTKPGATTKQKTLHRVPLSAPARQLLADIRKAAETEAREKDEEVSEYVFPGRKGEHRVEIKRAWRELCIAAGIVKAEKAKNAKGEEITVLTPTARVHDLRHTYASVLASAGQSLPVIGALLGHTQPQTTARYAHLFDDPLRAATERVGATVMPAEGAGAEVVKIGERSNG